MREGPADRLWHRGRIDRKVHHFRFNVEQPEAVLTAARGFIAATQAAAWSKDGSWYDAEESVCALAGATRQVQATAAAAQTATCRMTFDIEGKHRNRVCQKASSNWAEVGMRTGTGSNATCVADSGRVTSSFHFGGKNGAGIGPEAAKRCLIRDRPPSAVNSGRAPRLYGLAEQVLIVDAVQAPTAEGLELEAARGQLIDRAVGDPGDGFGGRLVPESREAFPESVESARTRLNESVLAESEVLGVVEVDGDW